MRVRLSLDGVVVGPAGEVALQPLLGLLDGVAETGSLGGAADRIGMSYRSAWGRLAQIEAAFGRPLVTKTKGHGSSLTPFGQAVLDCLAASRDRIDASLANEERDLTRRLDSILGADAAPLRLAASHDPLLMDLAPASGFDLAVAGSEDAVARLLKGEADAAGFHHDDLAAAKAAFPRLFSERLIQVHPLYRREQGLIVAPGNPLGMTSIADLARLGARFINRQRGSGTRAWFDRLLAEASIPASAILGYGIEEFTHAAVAAMVASGAADAGMGVRLVAERLGLAFLPLGQETYYLATALDPAHPAIAGLLARCRAPITWAGYSHAG